MNNRILVTTLIGIVIVVGLSVQLFLPANVSSEPPAVPNSFGWDYEVNETRLDEFIDGIKSGGPPPDGIPPIENPIYWSVEDANTYLADSDIVFGFIYNGSVYAYPQRILVWHEIVNEEMAGDPISITYCPLTGSCIAYHGTLDGNGTTFGTSGKLINSNLVMYDRETESYWPQVLSQAITGSYRGFKLEKLQTIWTTWGLWKTAYPETLVLSEDTGYIRNYYRDPYGSYDNLDSYYYQGQPFFPVLNTDDRLGPKTPVVAIHVNGYQAAVEKSYLATAKVVNIQMGNSSYVLFYDSSLKTANSYYSHVQGEDLLFSLSNGNIVDNVGRIWSVDGTSSYGALASVVNIDVMWFAWVAFFPDTGLYVNSYP
ncbi:MAG: DUF3179 domain-containing protein [Candidatus Thorarchaeota archaeon]